MFKDLTPFSTPFSSISSSSCLNFSQTSSRRFGTVAALRAQRIGYIYKYNNIYIQCAARAKPPPCQTCGWKLEKKLKQDDENMLENEVENGVEIGVKSLKIRAPGVVWSSWATLLAPRWPKMRFWTRLGLYLEVCWGASWRQDGPSCGQDGAKLPNLAPRWAQDGHLRFQNGQLETISGGILPIFKDIGCEKPDSRKPKKP